MLATTACPASTRAATMVVDGGRRHGRASCGRHVERRPPAAARMARTSRSAGSVRPSVHRTDAIEPGRSPSAAAPAARARPIGMGGGGHAVADDHGDVGRRRSTRANASSLRSWCRPRSDTAAAVVEVELARRGSRRRADEHRAVRGRRCPAAPSRVSVGRAPASPGVAADPRPARPRRTGRRARPARRSGGSGRRSHQAPRSVVVGLVDQLDPGRVGRRRAGQRSARPLEPGAHVVLGEGAHRRSRTVVSGAATVLEQGQRRRQHVAGQLVAHGRRARRSRSRVTTRRRGRRGRSGADRGGPGCRTWHRAAAASWSGSRSVGMRSSASAARLASAERRAVRASPKPALA